MHRTSPLSKMRVQRVRVSGPSMVPTLRDGDLVLVLLGASARPGDVVLARFRSMPDRLVLKRALAFRDGAWELVSDNEFAGGDSRAHGPADVEGRALVRISVGSRRPRRVQRRG